MKQETRMNLRAQWKGQLYSSFSNAHVIFVPTGKIPIGRVLIFWQRCVGRTDSLGM